MPSFKTGDKVKIVRKAQDRSAGFDNVWIDAMDQYVGNDRVYTVREVTTKGIWLFETASDRVHAYRWPPDALEFVGRATSEPTSPTTEENLEMNLKIEDRVYVNGINAKDLDSDALIGKIAEAEAEVERLRKLTTKSDAIKARILSLTAGAERLAALLDERL